MKFDTLIFTNRKIDDITTNMITGSLVVLAASWLIKNVVGYGFYWVDEKNIETITETCLEYNRKVK